MARKKRARPPIHPGEVLLEEFMKPLGLSANKLGLDLRVPANRILEIVKGERSLSADTALRLARQARYDLEKASDELAETIAREVNPRAA
jgi:addiction module HigA family antidote